jgi:predicted transcriptional regulator
VPNLTVTKKVRMDQATSILLARLARATGRSEGDLLREGVHLVERETRRRAAIEGLIALIEGPEPRKVAFRGR